MGSVHILCVNVNVTIYSMLNFDPKTDSNIDVDTKCEWILCIVRVHACMSNAHERMQYPSMRGKKAEIREQIQFVLDTMCKDEP